jgi:hypothetical protein
MEKKKIYFLAKVISSQGNPPRYTVAINPNNIHHFPEEPDQSQRRVVLSKEPLPTSEYIYIYDAELDQERREVVVKGFTKISKPENKDILDDQAYSPIETPWHIIIDDTSHPCDVPPKMSLKL